MQFVGSRELQAILKHIRWVCLVEPKGCGVFVFVLVLHVPARILFMKDNLRDISLSVSVLRCLWVCIPPPSHYTAVPRCLCVIKLHFVSKLHCICTCRVMGGENMHGVRFCLLICYWRPLCDLSVIFGTVFCSSHVLLCQQAPPFIHTHSVCAIIKHPGKKKSMLFKFFLICITCITII